MLSVIIINSDIFERYKKYEYFFNWFEDHSNIILSVWNKHCLPDAGIDEMIPQLFDVIKNQPEWNAYIVDEPFDSSAYIENDFDNKTQFSINPYERANCAGEAYDPEQDPLMRLVYLLGGRGIEKLEYIKNYRFRAARPTGIFLVTPRIFEDLDMQKVFLQNEIGMMNVSTVKNADAILNDAAAPVPRYSDFWGRYEYPPNCRFLAFDMPYPASTQYDDAWFMLWISLMSVVMNFFNSSEIGPYKLYILKTDLNTEGLTAFLNKFYTALLGAGEESMRDIENEIKLIKNELSDTSSNHPEDCAPVVVTFPDTQFSEFLPDDDEYGRVKDKPRLDTEVWKERQEITRTQTTRLFKATVRGKNEAVDAMNRTLSVDLPMLKNQHISRYDAEDIADDIAADELEMLDLETNKKATRAMFENKLKKAAKKVEKAMIPRVTKKTFRGIVIAGCAVAMGGFLPFIVSSFGHNVTSGLIAFVIAGCTCGALALAAYISLRILHGRFLSRLRDYTDTVLSCLQEVRDGADIQSRYLSLLLNYMEKYEILTSGRIEERHLQRLNKLAQIHACYEEAIEQCKAIAGVCHLQLTRVNEAQIGDNVLFTPGTKIYLHEDTEGMKIPLNEITNRLKTPFSFVERLQINEESIYECSAYYRYNKDEEGAML